MNSENVYDVRQYGESFQTDRPMYKINFKKTYVNNTDKDMIISIDAITSNSAISIINKSATDSKPIIIDAKKFNNGELNQMQVRKGD